VAQRLVRIICPDCKSRIRPEKEILKEFGIDKNVYDAEIYKGRGCESCKFTGYKGRTAIYEFLVMDNEIREMVLRRLSPSQIKDKALDLGMRSLRMDGWAKIEKGITTIDEVVRVTKED
jgi:type II secretory ATPase GspE/PulE/Tfp pilus assembly ATPase PilB-like protein